MKKRRARAHGATATLALGLVLSALPGLTGSAATAAPPEDPTIRPASPRAVAAAQEVLEDPAGGVRALRLLGGDVRLVARRNDLAPTELREELRADDSLWVATDGRLFYVDPEPTQPQRETPPPTAQAPLAETFRLHSNPTATRTIFLDVDGATVEGTGWNSQFGVGATHPAWDPAGNGPIFDDTEKARVQQVWASVAEDFAPYDVDVTTEDPGADGVRRTSSADTRYGTHVLVSPSDDAYAKTCNRGCGGIAYVDVFDLVRPTGAETYQPAWVFPQGLGSTKAVAEAASHEVGHTLGLAHDGLVAEPYYDGHASWAPIMGRGYYRPISQWSKGDYTGANQAEDDLAVMGRSLPRRQDEAGAAVSPAALPATTATQLVTTRDDVDAYQLGSCQAGATVRVAPRADATNLDVVATLRNESGATIATADPPSATVSAERASGMDATVTVPTAGSGYLLTVRGAGNGPASSGYDTYGSLGAYGVEAPGCTGVVAGVPDRPDGVTATADPDGPTITLRWSAPARTGSGPVTGYVVSINEGRVVELGADARSYDATGLDLGRSYDLAVSAVNASGQGPAGAATAQTVETEAALPGTPVDLRASFNAGSSRVEIFWDAPTSDGGREITAYRIHRDGTFLGTVPGTARGASFGGVQTFGRHEVVLTAVNVVGEGPGARTTYDVPFPNDDVDRAQVLTGASGRVSGDNAAASAAADDPTPPGGSGAGGYSLWYSWQAPATGSVRFATESAVSGRDTTLAAYTGARGSLREVAGNDDDPAGGFLSVVEFRATEGRTYLLGVDGFEQHELGRGPFDLVWRLTPDASAPDAPTGVTATAGDRAATVAWTAARTNGSPVTGYTVTASPGGRTATVTGDRTSASVDGLTNGTAYRFTVTATSAAGTSPSASSGSVTPAGVPDRMGKPSASGGRKKVVVAWSEASGNGAPITGYRVLVSGTADRDTSADQRRLVVKRVNPGRHTVRVVAVNVVGGSTPSPKVRVKVRR